MLAEIHVYNLLLGAISAIANDGVYMRPFVVKYIKDNHDQIIRETKPEILDKVISAETSLRVKSILQGVVERGTGVKAQIKGFTVAGKTGTAQKVVGGTYSHGHFYATFVGFAPVENPRLAAVVVFDEPHPAYYGGTVSAPVFSEVIGDSLKYLNAKQMAGIDGDKS
ncbi:MAG: penicillin-binding transpeptidase domain-containing protein [Candidatus Omnitrophota bacterium]